MAISSGNGPTAESERHRTQAMECRAKALFHHHPHPLFELDPMGHFRHANLAAGRFANLHENEAQGLHFSRFLDADDAAQVEQHFNKAASGVPCRCLATIRTPDGQRHRVHLSLLPVMREQQVMGIFAMLEEPDALRGMATVTPAAQRLVEAIPVGVALLDLTQQDYPVLLCNQALCRLLDMPRDVLEGHPLPVLRERESLAVREMHNALARRQPIRERLTLTRRGGQPLAIHLYLQPVEPANGDSEAVHQMLALHVTLHDTDSGSRSMERGLLL